MSDDVTTYIREREARDPEFAKAMAEERAKLARRRERRMAAQVSRVAAGPADAHARPDGQHREDRPAD